MWVWALIFGYPKYNTKCILQTVIIGQLTSTVEFWDLASIVVQLVKNLPAMRETWVRSLGWEDPLEKGKATHSSILAWRIPWTV